MIHKQTSIQSCTQYKASETNLLTEQKLLHTAETGKTFAKAKRRALKACIFVLRNESDLQACDSLNRCKRTLYKFVDDAFMFRSGMLLYVA